MTPETSALGDLPDVNVWLSLTVKEHPHHLAAQQYWHETAADRVMFNRVTMLGLVRLLKQPRVMGTAAFDAARAWESYRSWRAVPEVGFQEETTAFAVGTESLLAKLCMPNLPPRLLTDAYLAAFAQASGLCMVTFDQNFRRFADQDRVILVLGSASPGG